MVMDDLKKMNAPQKRDKGTVYGVGVSGGTDFHRIETIPITQFGNKTLGQVFTELQNELKVANDLIAEKTEIIKKALKEHDKRIKKIEKAVEKYGMDY